MYRILIARNGYYYVQHHSQLFQSGWEKIGGFFKSRAGAKAFIRDFRLYKVPGRNVVEYVD